jgi:hypothetical protein
MNNALFSIGCIMLGFFIADLCYMSLFSTNRGSLHKISAMVNTRESWVTTFLGLAFAVTMMYFGK